MGTTPTPSKGWRSPPRIVIKGCSFMAFSALLCAQESLGLDFSGVRSSQSQRVMHKPGDIFQRGEVLASFGARGSLFESALLWRLRAERRAESLEKR
jgi:hypothetical protein